MEEREERVNNASTVSRTGAVRTRPRRLMDSGGGTRTGL